MEKILENKGKTILLGNNAIVRAALETGVQFITTYPGTPASEIGDIFYHLQRQEIKNKRGFYFEYSTNEKVALEAAIGASFSGLKTLVVMKHFGLNVCSDALLPFLYTGSRGSTVIVVGDDPSCHSSAQSEQDSRAYSYLAHLPTLEPADPREAKQFTKLAFEISEKFKIPVMIRITTRVAHQRMPVNLEKLPLKRELLKEKTRFIKNQKKFVTMPHQVLEMKKELLKKIRKIQEFSEKLKINKIENSISQKLRQSRLKIVNYKLGIIASGVSYLYVKEALHRLNLSLPILKLGFFYPLPRKKIENFIKNLEKVLVVEELEPYLEKEIERFSKKNPKLQIYGKNLLPEIGELKPEFVISALAKLCGKKNDFQNLKTKISNRPPQFCPGCPYWLVFSAVKKAVDFREVVFGGDIGCYMMAGLPPHFLQDYLSCMGSSVGIAHGIKKSVNKQKMIAFIGDATFFHAGIPGLINVIHNQSNPLIIVMDNQTTAMTGHQPHPGLKSDNLAVVKIEDIIRACGVKNLKIIDPIKTEEMIKTIKMFLKNKEASVIISRRPCVRIK